MDSGKQIGPNALHRQRKFIFLQKQYADLPFHVYDVIFVRDNVANFMHIVGGVCGTVFGYTYAAFPRRKKSRRK